MDNRRIDERKKRIKEKRIRRVRIMRNLLSCLLVCLIGSTSILAAEIYEWHAAKKAVAASAEKSVQKSEAAAKDQNADADEQNEANGEEEEIIEEEELNEHSRGAALLDEVNLYREASEESEVIAIVNYGERVGLLEEGDTWYHVQYGDLKGYVKRSEVVRFNDTKKQVALTFDDGPSSKNTPVVLDALEKYKCRATFFLVGENITEATGEIVQREVSLGCAIGNHTYSHANLKALDKKKAIKNEFSKANKNIKKYIGTGASLVRTPYGATSKTVLSVAGAPNIYWSIDTEDWKYKDTERLIKYVNKHAKDGSIILMHDIHESTAQAVASICSDLREKDFEMVTVPELAAIHGTRLETGNTYFGFEAEESEE